MILQQDKVGAKAYELAEREAIAADWFELAARSNHAGAMVRLGFLHEKGVKINRNQVLVDKSIAKAAKWYQRAADGEHNNPEAQNALGLLFYKNQITHKVLDELKRDSDYAGNVMGSGNVYGGQSLG